MILVTGGAGALGSRLVRRLRARGIPVRVVGLPHDPARHVVEALGAEYFGIDILDGEALREAFRGIQAVAHLAARVLSRRDPGILHRVNVEGTANVVAAARGAGVERLVHVSSISVMYRHQNGYSRSKARAEAIVRESGLDWTILRPTLAWGDPKAVEYAAFARIVARAPILPLPGGGTAIKSPVHVDDLAEAFDAALVRKNADRRILDLCGPDRIPLAEMARRIRSARGRSGRVLPVPAGVSGLAILAHARLWTALGWEPRVDWQTWTGLVEDACPDPAPARLALDWNPRGFDPAADGLWPGRTS